MVWMLENEVKTLSSKVKLSKFHVYKTSCLHERFNSITSK